MARKQATKIAFKELDEKQRKAYLAIKREEALNKLINDADFSITTVETKKYELTSGKYKGYSEVGADSKDAKKKLFDELLKKYSKDNQLDDFAPQKETQLVNLDKINEYIADKGL